MIQHLDTKFIIVHIHKISRFVKIACFVKIDYPNFTVLVHKDIPIA